MGSNNSWSSSGGGSGENDGYGGGDSLYSKKQKRQKVPKRGPGVAELEKILREQESRSDLSLMSPASYKNFTAPAPLLGGGDSGGKVRGTGMCLPEQDLLPTMWNANTDGNNFDGKFVSRFQFSNGSPNQLFPSSNNLMHTSTLQHSLPSTKNMLPSTAAFSSSLVTLSAGSCHGREPPSIQTSYRHSSLWPMVGEKRGRAVAVPMDIPPVPNFRYPIPTFSAPINRLDSPFSCDPHSTLFNLDPFDPSISRLEPNSKRSHIDENGESSDGGNSLIFPSPTTPPSLVHTPNMIYPFPLQENNGESHQMGNAQGGGSVRKKPYYSFLAPREKTGMAESLNTERVETKGDGIDLELRL